MPPRTLYRRIAVAEVVTWALLLLGMFLKYVTRTTDLAVSVFGLVHGVVFIAFCLVTVLLWVDQRWTARDGVLGLLSAVPPFLTVWWERRLERRGALAEWLAARPRRRGTVQPCGATRRSAAGPAHRRSRRGPRRRCRSDRHRSRRRSARRRPGLSGLTGPDRADQAARPGRPTMVRLSRSLGSRLDAAAAPPTGQSV